MPKLLIALGKTILDLIETIVTSLVIFVIIYLFVFQPHQVKGNSMLPNFEDGQYLLTNKISYRLHKAKRGDVIVFKAPLNHNYDYIKRIIGLPGEKVSLKNGKFFINGAKLDESKYLEPDLLTNGGAFLAEGGEIIVPQNQYFVDGDNRHNSSDSREWGCVSKDFIVGKAWLRYWPPAKFGLIPTITE